jgi:hypothetical protein
VRENLMPHSLAENANATGRNGALNKPSNPCGTALVEDDQFLLGSADQRVLLAASRLAALMHQAAKDNGFSFGTLGGLIEKDASAVSRAFDPDDPSTGLKLIAGLLLLDRSHSWLTGACRLTGGEYVERPRLTPEQKLERLTATCRRHGRLGAALIEEALGEDAP